MASPLSQEPDRRAPSARAARMICDPAAASAGRGRAERRQVRRRRRRGYAGGAARHDRGTDSGSHGQEPRECASARHLDGYFLPKPLPADLRGRRAGQGPAAGGFELRGAGRAPFWASAIADARERSPALSGGSTATRPTTLLKAVRALPRPMRFSKPRRTLPAPRFIAYGTWKWTELQMKTGGKPVYRYLYARPRPGISGIPAARPAPAGRRQAAGAAALHGPRGAVHSAEIQYAMGNLRSGQADTPGSRPTGKSPKSMQAYFVNFIKTGNPNGAGLPEWPRIRAPTTTTSAMRIDVESHAEPEPHRDLVSALSTPADAETITAVREVVDTGVPLMTRVHSRVAAVALFAAALCMAQGRGRSSSS